MLESAQWASSWHSSPKAQGAMSNNLRKEGPSNRFHHVKYTAKQFSLGGIIICLMYISRRFAEHANHSAKLTIRSSLRQPPLHYWGSGSAVPYFLFCILRQLDLMLTFKIASTCRCVLGCACRCLPVSLVAIIDSRILYNLRDGICFKGSVKRNKTFMTPQWGHRLNWLHEYLRSLVND